MLTNAGSITETQETQILNESLNTDLEVDKVLLCHTPLGQKDIVESYKDKVIVTAAPNENACLTIAEEYGYKNYLSLFEFACIYPNLGG